MATLRRIGLSSQRPLTPSPLWCSVSSPLCVSQRCFSKPVWQVKNHKEWSWYVPKEHARYKHKKQLRRKQANWRKNMRLPKEFVNRSALPGQKVKIKVLFIQNMDEFVAGDVAVVPDVLYRSWLWPNKIALPANKENRIRFGDLNAQLRKERAHNRSMISLAKELSQLRMELTIRRDSSKPANYYGQPLEDQSMKNNKEEDHTFDNKGGPSNPADEGLIHSKVSKRKICRHLLIKKQLSIDPSRVFIVPYSVGRAAMIGDRVPLMQMQDSLLDCISSEGAYMVVLESEQGLQFNCRLNVRCTNVNLEKNYPSLEKSRFRIWKRAKLAHELVDDVTRPGNRYSGLYQNRLLKHRL